jgi:sugar lactone lactonase YvrE
MEPGLGPGRSGLMSRTIPWFLLVLLPVIASPAAGQDDPVLASRAAFQLAVKAYQAHDVPAFLAHAREAERLRPDHGGVIYTLASACALSGDTAGAFDMLRRFAKLGYTADVAADSDFARVRSLPAFEAVRGSLARNAEPVMRSRAAFTLPERDLLTEGIAYDPRTGAFFVGSVHHRKIVRVERSGRVAEFVASARDGLWAPLGMRADSARGVLWVATTALPQMVGYDTADAGRSGVYAFDLATGALRGRYLLPRDGTAHALGDVAITRHGDVYASDSRAPVIYRVRAGAATLEEFIRSPLLLSAQGMAFDRAEQTMYLADYSRGLLRVDLETRDVQPVPAADGVLTLGIDGLYAVGDALIGVQNGVAPYRVVRLHLDGDGRRVVGADVLERARPDYAEPTLGVVVGSTLYYVANSQWERFRNDGTIEAPAELKAPLVLRLPL